MFNGPWERRRWDREWRHGMKEQWKDQFRPDRFRERIFGKGDLKYLILDLLKDQPRHGYDIIRELEHRSGGMYTPSAGAVYPTLQMLEDMSAVTSEQQDGRKTYTITDEGRRILEERRDVIDDITGRVRDWVNREGHSELGQAMRELGELMALLGRDGGRALGDQDKLRRVRETIGRTREELRGILRNETTQV
ncbi:MAG TPA: PadR family transcriptional regulator [Chloroflexota bacterium]|nr:PadR family transcriptional regulator [Chloroflexota bacterium]